MSEIDSNPSVSLIIPVFNQELYLHQCLRSVNNQLLDNIEVICVNDGSTDNSLSILVSYAEKDSRITVHSQKNQGLASARNTGIAISRGEYIAFLDADDFIEDSMLYAMYAKAVCDDLDVVICGYNITDSSGKVVSVNSQNIVSSDKGYVLQSTLAAYMSSMVCNKIFKKDLFVDNDLSFPVGLYHEDVLINYKLLYFASKVGAVNSCFYNWRNTEGSISRSVSVKHVKDIFIMLRDTKLFMLDNKIYRGNYVYYLRRYFNYSFDLISRIEGSGLCAAEKVSLVKILVKLVSEDNIITSESCARMKEEDNVFSYNCRNYLINYGLICDSNKSQSLDEQIAILEGRLLKRYDSVNYKLSRYAKKYAKMLFPVNTKRRRLLYKFIYSFG